MFLKILSYLDNTVEWNQFLNDRKNDFEETEKFLHEAQAFREQYKKNHYPDSYDEDVLQKLIKIKQDTIKMSEELEKKLREEMKHFREFANMLDLPRRCLAESITRSLFSSDLHSINKNFTLQKQNYKIDIENSFITGIIKNEQNNKLVYFFFKHSNYGNQYYLIPIQSENDIDKIPAYPKYPEEKYLIKMDDLQSKLCDLLK